MPVLEQEELNDACKRWLEAKRKIYTEPVEYQLAMAHLRHACEKAEAAGLFEIPRGDQHGS